MPLELTLFTEACVNAPRPQPRQMYKGQAPGVGWTGQPPAHRALAQEVCVPGLGFETGASPSE